MPALARWYTLPATIIGIYLMLHLAQEAGIHRLVGWCATVANFNRALDLVYDTSNTSLTTAHRQHLIRLVLETAAQSPTPGIMYNVKDMVG